MFLNLTFSCSPLTRFLQFLKMLGKNTCVTYLSIQEALNFLLELPHFQ